MIAQLSTRFNLAAKHHFGAFDLKLDQFILMMAITESEDLTQTELGQRVSLANYAVTRALDVLETRGLVERRADANSRRTRRIFLTDDGRALMPDLFDAVRRINAEVLAPLPEQSRAGFTQSLAQLVKADSSAPDKT